VLQAVISETHNDVKCFMQKVYGLKKERNIIDINLKKITSSKLI